ncbi:MAG: zinc dependent phospholipase C family protein [Coriobacteriales bacterium]|jgi:hypothetical protein|nr:zinc dependent phospholipase C family protein [Coriobacteriales bacterium]
MPALLSHHLFGRALLARENNRAFLTRDARDAFLLGNQGPDPLFYAVRTPYLIGITNLGMRMHHEHIKEYLGIWRDMLDRLQIKDHVHEVLRAYVYGFICHYDLDRAVHPLVYAFEEAICSAGVEGLGPRDHSFVHGQIEADLDVYELYRLTGRTVEEYHIPKQVLYASDAVLSSIDTLYGAAARVFGIAVPRAVLTRSVKDMRMTVRLLYSPSGIKRGLLGRAERLLRPHSLLQAMSHRVDAHTDVWYANESREPWLHPETRDESRQSFNELFDATLDTAVADMRLFREGAPIAEIIQGLDFSGNTAREKAYHREAKR